MKRSRKSNRVSWASGVDLCQVKLFSNDDFPSKISMQAQEHLVSKKSLTGHETVDFPPGFGSSPKFNRLQEEASRIPRTEWKCPPKIVISHEWHMATGEESQEKDVQNLRELGVLEAVYPRLSAIPHSPSESREVEVEHWNDRLTLIVPLTPIEEEEAADVPSDLVEPWSAPMCSQSSELFRSSMKLYSSEYGNNVSNAPASQKPLLPAFGADLVTAASAALSAVVKSKEQGSFIDTNLLARIFCDTEMIEKLISNSQAPASATSLPMLPLKPDSVPPVCFKPSAPLAPTAAMDKLIDVDAGTGPIAQSGMTSITPVPGTTMLLTPNPSNGTSQHLHSDVKPNRVASQRYATHPVSEFKQVAPSFSMPLRPAVGNLYAIPNLVQPTLSSMPTQPNTVLQSSPLPNTIPSRTPPFSNVMPTQPNGAFQPPPAATHINPVKDMNYIKNLIREHGADKQDKRDQTMFSQNGFHYNTHIQNMEMAQNIKMGEAKPKYQKPCAYFMSSKGCRNGSNCPYQHDLPIQWQTGSSIMHTPSAKRMKFGGEIAGR